MTDVCRDRRPVPAPSTLGRHRRWCAGLGVWFGVALAACGGGSTVPSAEPPPAPSVGPLMDLIPQGPRLVVEARPVELAKRPAARRLWRVVMPERRQAHFQQRTGVDPLTVQELVLAELRPRGYLLLARGPFDADLVVREAGARLATLDVSQDDPVVRREGLAGRGRYSYAALDPHTVLVGRDAPPSLVGQTLQRATGQRTAAGILDSPDAQALYAEYRSFPVALYVPQPLQLPEPSGLAVLLARQRALAAGFEPETDVIRVEIALRGEFPDGVENNFRALVQSVGATDLGAALGLAEVGDDLRIRVDEGGVVLRFPIRTATLVQGVRVLFLAELQELLSIEPGPVP